MKTLAITNDKKNLYYCIFDKHFLKIYGKIELYKVKGTYEFLRTLMTKHEIAFVVLVSQHLERVKRKDALITVKTRTIVKLITEQLGIVYTTPSTYGWDRYFYGDKIQDYKLAKEKLKIANELFSIDINESELANVIMLGWTFTLNKYKVYEKGDYDL